MRNALLALIVTALAGTGCEEKKAQFTPVPPQDSGADKVPPPRPEK